MYKTKNPIGIMQGRLVPPGNNSIQAFPRERWAEEFPRAAEAGLDCIEWIYDAYGQDVNPLATDEGIARMKTLSAEHGVAVRSACLDYFIDYPLVRAGELELVARLAHLEWLTAQCRKAGIPRITLPFVDRSAIATEAEMQSVVETLRRALPMFEAHGVELHLETSLSPADFARLLAALPHPLVHANYDSGNSASLGYDAREEFAAYGPRVGSVHIKDRVRGGGTVPLGEGDADLPALFECLRAVHYSGDLILQVARGEEGKEVEWARRNREFVVRGMAGV